MCATLVFQREHIDTYPLLFSCIYSLSIVVCLYLQLIYCRLSKCTADADLSSGPGLGGKNDQLTRFPADCSPAAPATHQLSGH